MSLFEQFLIVGTVLLAVYIVVTIAVLLQTILQHRDELYKSKYEDFIQQKNRVIEEINRGKKNAK